MCNPANLEHRNPIVYRELVAFETYLYVVCILIVHTVPEAILKPCSYDAT